MFYKRLSLPGCKYGRVVKGVNFVQLRNAGDPVRLQKHMMQQEQMNWCFSILQHPANRGIR